MQLKADVTGKRVRTFSSGGYASTLGAAILAGVGTGVWPDFAAACDAVIHPAEAYEPNEKNRAVYDSGYDIYRKLYPATKQLMIERQKLTPFED
jgi:xylulokinase